MEKGDIVIVVTWDKGQSIAIYDGKHETVRTACYIILAAPFGYRYTITERQIEKINLQGEE